MCLSTFSGRDPMAVSPRRIMSDMLLMYALELSNPVQIFIQMKANNFPQLTQELSWRFHKVLPELDQTIFQRSFQQGWHLDGCRICFLPSRSNDLVRPGLEEFGPAPPTFGSFLPPHPAVVAIVDAQAAATAHSVITITMTITITTTMSITITIMISIGARRRSRSASTSTGRSNASTGAGAGGSSTVAVKTMKHRVFNTI